MPASQTDSGLSDSSSAVNRRAQALYAGLGLTEVATCGGHGTKLTMRLAHHRE